MSLPSISSATESKHRLVSIGKDLDNDDLGLILNDLNIHGPPQIKTKMFSNLQKKNQNKLLKQNKKILSNLIEFS